MDTMTDREFVSIFDRTSEYISFKGCETPEDVKRRMKRSIDFMKTMSKEARGAKTRARWRNHMVHMKTLLRSGFHRKIIEIAIRRPRSIIGLTLTYGKSKAKRILLERRKGELRYVKRR